MKTRYLLSEMMKKFSAFFTLITVKLLIIYHFTVFFSLVINLYNMHNCTFPPCAEQQACCFFCIIYPVSGQAEPPPGSSFNNDVDCSSFSYIHTLLCKIFVWPTTQKEDKELSIKKNLHTWFTVHLYSHHHDHHFNFLPSVCVQF